MTQREWEDKVLESAFESCSKQFDEQMNREGMTEKKARSIIRDFLSRKHHHSEPIPPALRRWY